MTSEINNTPQEKNAGCFGIGFSVIFPIVLKTEDIHCYTSDLQGFRNGAFQAPLLKYCYFA